MRYAIYYTPPAQSPLTKAAALWLGRNAFDIETTNIQAITPRDNAQWVQAPARYGFHATLKAPFRLSADKSETELLASFDSFCAQQHPFSIEHLILHQLGAFFGLVPAPGDESDIAALAERCVRYFEPFRAPLNESEIARRAPEKLDPKQRAYLEKWGYPYIFDAFHFHMSLTGPIADIEQNEVKCRIEDHFEPFLNRPLAVDHLALFFQSEANGTFTVKKINRLGQN